MAVEAASFPGVADPPRLAISVERLRGALLWLTGFSGAFVFMEPSPYEVTTLLTMSVFLLTGLTLRASVMPLMLLLIFSNIGFSLAVIELDDIAKPVIWVLVSWYMALTCVFYAAALGENTEQRVGALLRGYTVAAVVCSIVAVLAYFRVFGGGSELFLKFGRARSTFNDPNVLGAFLVPPALLAFSRVLSGRLRDATRAMMTFGIIMVALLLSFSRGAWGQFAGGAALLMVMMLITTRSGKQRVRILGVAILGVVGLALCVAALLSIPQVADLFKERASLDQNYDSGHFGRFGRHILGFALALETPLGIGPLQFGKIFPEDPHNTYLNEFMSGGWISGLSYLALVLISLVLGWRFLFVPSPWQRTYIVLYCAFIAVVGESAIIDTDHWRHYWLLLGALWGLMGATRTYSAGQSATLSPRAVARRRLAALPASRLSAP